MTPLGQRPLDLGADVVVSLRHQGQQRSFRCRLGPRGQPADRTARSSPPMAQHWPGRFPGPFEAWLVHRGLETLEMRFAEDVRQRSAAVAERLAGNPAVVSVRYPGLADHPQHDLARKQMTSFGSVVAVTFADGATAERFIAGVSDSSDPQPASGGFTPRPKEGLDGARTCRRGSSVFRVGTEPTDELLSGIEEALG